MRSYLLSIWDKNAWSCEWKDKKFQSNVTLEFWRVFISWKALLSVCPTVQLLLYSGLTGLARLWLNPSLVHTLRYKLSLHAMNQKRFFSMGLEKALCHNGKLTRELVRVPHADSGLVWLKLLGPMSIWKAADFVQMANCVHCGPPQNFYGKVISWNFIDLD